MNRTSRTSVRPSALLLAVLLAAAESAGTPFGPAPASAQTQLEVTIPTALGDTTETFWLQIPRGYQPMTPRPLLLGWHQWGGNRHEMQIATSFDSIADARGWVIASHDGVGSTHWNNHPTQSHVDDVIRWIEEHYAIDVDRIYMVGASMGGAAGMVFASNHLDPMAPMVAAAASLSGIQDCERRFHEQGINHSMIASFGGTPEEAPFEYHRNSATVFADPTQSMHVNARHLPLYLTFGLGSSDQVWREHAEDLYAEMVAFADTVELRESVYPGHGWGCAEEARICDFLAAQTLDRSPRRVSIQADEEGRWYWADLTMRSPVESFARFEAEANPERRHLDVAMIRNVARVRLDLPAVGFPVDGETFTCAWSILDGAQSELGLLGLPRPPTLVLRDGALHIDWSYDAGRGCLTIRGDGTGLFAIVFDPSSVSLDDPMNGPIDRPALRLHPSSDGSCGVVLSEAGTFCWRLLDVTGRQLEVGEAARRSAGLFRLDPGPGRPSGVCFLQVTFTGRTGVTRAVGKLVSVR